MNAPAKKRKRLAIKFTLTFIAAVALAALVQWGMWRSPFPHIFLVPGYIGMVAEVIVEGGIDNASLGQHYIGQVLCMIVNTGVYSLIGDISSCDDWRVAPARSRVAHSCATLHQRMGWGDTSKM